MSMFYDRVLNPWWFTLWVLGLYGAGYFKEGRLGGVEGAVLAVILAHGALLEHLCEERRRNEKSSDLYDS